MESNLQARPQPVSQVRQQAGSNVFSKGVQSRLYQSFNLQTSTLSQHDRIYDPQYRGGFPKLYSFDTSVQNKSRISLDEKGKYSFRNDYSKIVQQNSMLIQQNSFLRQQISRLNVVIENERRSAGSRTEIDRLSAILIQRDTEIRTLNERVFVLQNQGSQTNEWQNRFNESQQRLNQSQQRYNQSQNIIAQLNAKINSLTQQVSQYESQFSQLNIRLTQYKTEITQLNTQINEYTTRITQLQRQQRQPAQQRADPQVDQLRNQVSSLTTKIEQYQIQISQYEKNFAKYESQITTLQQVNWKLEERLNRQEATTTAPVVHPTLETVDNESWLVEQGKLNFRIIILLEEINRLKQREQELLIKAEELHAYLLKAENYIEEIQLQLEKNNLKENVPAHIVEKVTLLQQQNTRYTVLIQELQSHLSTTQISGVSEDEHLARLGERDFRIIILLQEINRLNTKVAETRQYLERAENYIDELQKTIQQQETIIPAEVQNQIRYLSQQNHRLNELVQKYIEDLKHYKVNIQAPSLPKIEYQVPHEVEVRLAFLAQQNERLSQLIIELQERVKLQPATVIEYQASPEIETRLGLLAQENQRMTRYIIELQNRPTVIAQPVTTSEVVQSEFAKLQLQSIILLQEINRLNHANRQTATYLINAENFIQQLEIRLQQQTTSSTVETRVEHVVPEQLQQQLANNTLQRMILFQEINRLNHVVKEVQSHLINAEAYIEQCEVRMRELTQTNVQTVVEFQVPAEIENRLAFFAQENERLAQIINELQTRPARVETRVQQKVEFKIPAEIENRIALLASENERLERALSSRPETQADERLTFECAQLQFRVIILLQEINRLNHVRQQLIQNLINAENYIFQIESRPQQVGIPPEVDAELHSLRQQNQQLLDEISRISISYEQQISIYKTEISSINIQISNYRSEATTYKSRFQELQRRSSIVSSSSSQLEQELQAKLAESNFRVIILLEEINRLNHVRQETLQNLINAQSYILQIESRVQQVGIPPEVEAEVFSLRQHNQQLLEEISRLSITSTQSQIDYESQAKLAELNFRVIILLQEINRLNQKVSVVDKQRLEVIGHLVNAENYIQQLQIKCSQLQQLGTKQSTITEASGVVGSNSAIQELNVQLYELQNRGKLQIATRDFRIIILLEEINRLNHKIQSFGGSSSSASQSQLYALQQGKQEAERELGEILNHLRQAEEYIGELLRQNEGFSQERDQLLHELNTLKHRV